jgi:hypothetical protein
VDQQTLEARAYAVARRYRPLLVNTVVGFIGPEYLYDGKQIIRAGLEDHFCGKLLGLPMGCDVCYTNHADADQDDMDNLLVLLAASGLNFMMGVPGADDVMLNYQSTSFHDALFVRQLLGLQRAPEFEAWLQRMGITDAQGRLLPAAGPRWLWPAARPIVPLTCVAPTWAGGWMRPVPTPWPPGLLRPLRLHPPIWPLCWPTASRRRPRKPTARRCCGSCGRPWPAR